MNPEKINIYKACDEAIQGMNRENVKAFGQLKLAKWDEIQILRTVETVYRESARRARRRYYGVAFEAYLLWLAMCGVEPKKAHEMAEKTITDEFVDGILDEVDFVTLYRFNTETERKAVRLAEAMEADVNRDAEIDKALRYWSRQLGQYAINMTDYAVVQAFQDAGVKWIRWITMEDEKVCRECKPRHWKIYRIDEIPAKHWGCRCRVIPAEGPEEEAD